MNYQLAQLSLSQTHIRNLSNAVQSGSPAQLRLTKMHIKPGNVNLLLTKTQLNKLEKAREAGRGMVLNLSKTQLNQMKGRGFFGDLFKWGTDLAGKAISALYPGSDDVVDRVKDFVDDNLNLGEALDNSISKKKNKKAAKKKVMQQRIEEGEALRLKKIDEEKKRELLRKEQMIKKARKQNNVKKEGEGMKKKRLPLLIDL